MQIDGQISKPIEQPIEHISESPYFEKGGTRNHIKVDHITDDALASIFTFFRQERKKVDSVVPLKPNGEGAESLPIMPTDTITSSPTQIGNTELKWKKLLEQSTGAHR